jgi:membrane protease YdiL (CAAX protease family)
LPAFFALAFLLSWLIWVPLALDQLGWLPLGLDQGAVSVIRLFGTLGPALAAALVALVAGGWPAEKALWARLRAWRVGWPWYVAACLFFPALVFAVAGVYRWLPGAAPLPFQVVTPASLMMTGMILVVSVVGEELGWRGFALPRMVLRWPALTASLVLGTLWTAWHLPFWIVLGELDRFGWTYWLMNWAFIVGGTIFITWLMSNTGHSLPLAVLCHWTLNMVNVGYLPITTVVPAYLIFIGLVWVVAVVLLAVYGPQRLARPAASVFTAAGLQGASGQAEAATPQRP